jgi:type II secretory ATPase GspE/PulE/Tfp pilus assembly ATPase PilB-like protein
LDRLSYPSAPKSPKPYEENDQRIIYLWQEICSAALNTRASDIHIEALKESCCIRLRVDGDLIRYQNYQKDEHIRLIARIKILAKLDIAEQRVPQDGRLQISLNPSSPIIDCRVSTIPTLFGEKVVIRLLNTSAHELNIDHIGFNDLQGHIVHRALNQNHGLILVCGPTGSGKTRTLYSFLNHLNQEGRNLYTVEDPIEICLKGVNQVAYHPKTGLDFGVIIRALLRQDPDVMMIGEIRDRETAALAITAAQTGHLVLSTIHTRNALSCIDRLENLGVDRYAITNTLLFISSQRLVKRIDLNSIGGRIAIHEVLEFTNDLCAGIQHNLPLSEIKKIAQLEGFTTMYENAKDLVQKGIINDSSIIQEIFI